MFTVALSNVLLMLFFLIPGFILQKYKPESKYNLATLSTILLYVCSPAMIINSFINIEFSLKSLCQMTLFFIVSMLLQVLFFLILFLFLKKKFDDAKYRILSAGSVLGNVGFFGLPLINALFPQGSLASAYSMIMVVTMNIVVFTVGVYCITGNKEFMSIKTSILNPTTISFLVAILLYILSAKSFTPEILQTGVSTLGKMTTPLCMLILGVRLGDSNLKALITRPFVYLSCAIKLLLFPLFSYALVYFLPFDNVFKGSVLILCACPCASVVFNMAEIHHKEEELSANIVLLSTIISLITIPLLSLIIS